MFPIFGPPWLTMALLFIGLCTSSSEQPLPEDGVDPDGLCLLQIGALSQDGSTPLSTAARQMTHTHTDTHLLTHESQGNHAGTAKNDLLPSVDCVRVITMPGSDSMPPLEADLKRFGLWDRTTVQVETPDPEGGKAGCFRAHVRAWNLAGAECSNLLVLEDDAVLAVRLADEEPQSVEDLLPAGHGPQRVEGFLQAGLPYDLLLLGWNHWGARLEDVPDAECVFRFKPDGDESLTWLPPGSARWTCTHAYIISPNARRSMSGLQFNGTAIDVLLPTLADRQVQLAVRPSFATQRTHETGIGGHAEYQATSNELIRTNVHAQAAKQSDAYTTVSGLGLQCMW